jgi:hypothetical protein
MSIHIARRSAVGIAPESVSGTYVSPTNWTPHQSISLENAPENVPDNSAIGVVEEAFDSQVLYNRAEGAIEGFIQDEAFGHYLKSMFGSVNSTAQAGDNSDVFDHTFSVSQTNTRPTLSITEKNPNTDRRFTMALVRQLTITAEAKQWARFAATLTSKASTANSPASTPAIAIENKFPPVGISLKYADTVADLDGSGTSIPLRTFTASFENGGQDDPDALGYDGPAGMITETFKATVQLEGLYRDDTLRGFAQIASKKAIGIYITAPNVTIGDDQHPTLKVLFQPGFFSDWSKSNDLNANVTQQTTFNALYSTSQSKSVEAILTNERTSY